MQKTKPSKRRLPRPLTTEGNLTAYYNRLRKEGWKVAGRGAYARVFQKDGVVLKVAVDDPAYDKYLAYVLAHQDNPYFPKVYDVKRYEGVHYMPPVADELAWFKPLGSNVTTVMMEQLGKSKGKARKFSEKAADAARPWTNEHIKADNPHEQELFDVLYALRNDRRGYAVGLDLHAGNILLRGNQPVVTDPVC